MDLRLRFALAAGVLGATALGACKKADDDVAEQLARLTDRMDKQDKKLDQILQRLGTRPAAAAPQAPRQPDPAVTYSVPIDGEIPRGPATAKITVVEAADFA
jgi:hypothetical protein